MASKTKKKRQGKNRYRKSKTRSKKGGNLGSLPIRYFYPYNKNPDYLMERTTGGKKKRLRGGGLLDGIYSFGSILDLQNASQLVGVKSSSVIDHPAANVFQDNNM